MTAIKLTIAVLAAAVCGAAAGQGADTAERKFPLPDRGAFVAQVPRAWDYMAREPSNRLPPTIVFVPREGRPFEVVLTPIWPATKDRAPPTRDALRAQVERAAQDAKSQAVETELRIVELQGRSGSGFYFAATDRAPKPDEFKFMAHGIVRIGELTVPFTILTNDGQEAVVKQALDLLRGAAHDAAAR